MYAVYIDDLNGLYADLFTNRRLARMPVTVIVTEFERIAITELKVPQWAIDRFLGSLKR